MTLPVNQGPKTHKRKQLHSFHTIHNLSDSTHFSSLTQNY